MSSHKLTSSGEKVNFVSILRGGWLPYSYPQHLNPEECLRYNWGTINVWCTVNKCFLKVLSLIFPQSAQISIFLKMYLRLNKWKGKPERLLRNCCRCFQLSSWRSSFSYDDSRLRRFPMPPSWVTNAWVWNALEKETESTDASINTGRLSVQNYRLKYF